MLRERMGAYYKKTGYRPRKELITVQVNIKLAVFHSFSCLPQLIQNKSKNGESFNIKVFYIEHELNRNEIR